MKALEKKMDSEALGSSKYKSLQGQYEALGRKIGANLPDSMFIRTIKPCSCKSVGISINTEKGKCHFKCTNCGLSTTICENMADARDNWNNIVKSA